MISLYEELPETVVIDGKRYPIITDFREWVRLIALMRADDIDIKSKAICAMSWYKQRPTCGIAKAVDALAAFMRGQVEIQNQKESEDTTHRTEEAFSYEHDAEVIFADFMRVYGIDLLTIDYLHWWKFKTLLNGLPEDTEFRRRVHYRTVNLAEIENDKERKRIAKIKASIALPAAELADEDIGNAFW